MSKIGDKFLNMFGLNDDDFDDFDDEEFDDDFDDILESKSTKSEPKFKIKDKFQGFDNDETSSKSINNSSFEKPKSFTKPTSAAKIVPMKSSRHNGMEVCVIKPSSIEDTREISDTLISGRAVILNLEGLHLEIAQRIIDFCSGSCYAINGNLQKISNYIFIVTPETVDISGDFQDLFGSTGNGFDIPL